MWLSRRFSPAQFPSSFYRPQHWLLDLRGKLPDQKTTLPLKTRRGGRKLQTKPRCPRGGVFSFALGHALRIPRSPESRPKPQAAPNHAAFARGQPGGLKPANPWLTTRRSAFVFNGLRAVIAPRFVPTQLSSLFSTALSKFPKHSRVQQVLVIKFFRRLTYVRLEPGWHLRWVQDQVEQVGVILEDAVEAPPQTWRHRVVPAPWAQATLTSSRPVAADPVRMKHRAGTTTLITGLLLVCAAVNALPVRAAFLPGGITHPEPNRNVTVRMTSPRNWRGPIRPPLAPYSPGSERRNRQ